MRSLTDKRRLPGSIALALMIMVTVFWTYWGVGEMYFEVWWGGWLMRLAYLIPASAFLALTLAAFTWPRLGGWLLIILGGAFTIWFWSIQLSRGAQLNLQFFLGVFPVTGIVVLIGVLFLIEGRYRRQRLLEGQPRSQNRFRRNTGYMLAIGLSLLTAGVVSAVNLPIVLTRVDDGNRGERLIAANGAVLSWAPAGPGWNWQQPWGGYPSWDRLALYGIPPVGMEDKPGYEEAHATGATLETYGLCRYLSADGTTLMEEPQDVWRMPSTDEIARSLMLHNQNAGCTWDGTTGRMRCDRMPDKETPLWAPDEPPVYYWSADEYDAEEAYYVSYNGSVSHQPKNFGNPRHGYRCVREP
jgi:uncharacterized membrane protein